ncbi:MAG: CHASE2 domain-containing protein [Thermodesulfobacteriota bacterium]
MITGRFTPRQRRLWQGLAACLLALALLLPLLSTGRLNSIEYRSLDWLHRNFPSREKVSPDIALLYIDQKSIDFFQQARGIGWPWPRDAYGLVVKFLKAAGARAIIFDAIYSEPSVFASDFNDDETFAAAMSESRRVVQTLVLHREIKGGAPTEQERLAGLLKLGLAFERQGGPPPPDHQDVTMPIAPLLQAAWGLGVINIRPEKDGVVRRLRPIESLKGAVFPTLSLAVYLKLTGRTQVLQTGRTLTAGPAVLPLDDEGEVLVKYYGGLGTYRDYTIAAIIQSAMNLESGQPPLVPLDKFKDKIVFVGAKAASLYDLRSTPVAEALPGVEIHATFLNNLLAQDFLRQGSRTFRGLLIVLLLAASVTAAVLTRRVLTGALVVLVLAVLYLAGVILAFRQNLWLDLITPLAGQAAVFSLATLINYYGEGREKSAIRQAFARYLSPDVVSELIEKPHLLTLGGSRRVMTVFFSDLAGFTSISEVLSPENLVHLLNRYLSLMTGAIMRGGGTVDKFEGDAIMAFWGAPMPQPDHARRACLAALEQQKIMAEFRRQALAEGLPELKVRMGLNTGPMIVGNMGSEERFDYTVMGDAVNLASRLEGANKPFGTGIMISESTLEAAGDVIETRELDLLRVKGKKEPIRVFELMAKAGELPPLQARVREVYLRGLAFYRDMKFVEAEEAFQAALALDPDDGPSRTYLERCRAYRIEPPPPDWDRVFTMTTK